MKIHEKHEFQLRVTVQAADAELRIFSCRTCGADRALSPGLGGPRVVKHGHLLPFTSHFGAASHLF